MPPTRPPRACIQDWERHDQTFRARFTAKLSRLRALLAANVATACAGYRVTAKTGHHKIQSTRKLPAANGAT